MNKYFFIVPSIFLFGALVDGLPYGYFQVLRIVVTLSSAVIAFSMYENKKIFWAWLFGIIAVIFNPFMPIRLRREVWIMIDVAVGFLFVSRALIDVFVHKNDKKSS